MSGHTAGPWSVRMQTNGTAEIDAKHAKVRWHALASVITEVEGPDGESHEASTEGVANARLIAAAPELLEALVAAMAFIDSHVAAPDITSEMCRTYAALQAANPEAAIAKATGESE